MTVRYERRKIADMIPDAANPRTISKTAKRALAASIRRFGLVQPVIVNETTGRVVGGHQRIDAMREQGETEIDVVIGAWTEAEERALNVTLNNPAGQGEFTSGVGDFAAVALHGLSLKDFKELRLDALVLPPGGKERERREANALEYKLVVTARDESHQAELVGSDIKPTARMRQVSSMFDAPIEKKATRTWSGDVPIEDRDWSIGLIVGPSGAGKSTVARQMFGAEHRVAWDDRSVIDSFDASLSVEQVSNALSAVGFNTIPAWLRPYGTLSNGEKFRCDLARTIVSPDRLVWVDEFSSVVDRQVAKIGSHALARFVRSQPGRRFVAVGCHYDVIDWLQPDWILDPANMAFAWRSVQRRPSIDGIVKRASRSLWSVFAPYHYMSAELSSSARCFSLDVAGRPVAFAAILPLPVSSGARRGEAIYRVSRVVTLPDWQGCGVAFRLIETLGAAYKALGLRFRNYPASRAFIESHLRKPHTWSASGSGSASASASASKDSIGGGRACAVFEFCGPAIDRRQAELLLARG